MSYRFGKLQDSAGRLSRLTLDALGEEVYELTFIDVLNRAEKLGILDSAKDWLILRELRNLITHE